MRRRNVKEVPARTVTQHQKRPARLDAPRLQVHERRVANILHNLQLALQAHLNPILARPASGPVLEHLDGHQRLPIRLTLCRTLFP